MIKRKKKTMSEVDFEKCENCSIPVSYCDGTTRYKCGTRQKDVAGLCKYGEQGQLR
jgi:hypothetical protein